VLATEKSEHARVKLRVFISYSRDDLDFADQLDIALRLLSFDTSLDRHAIAGGEEWKQRLSNLIRASDTVVFVLSPASAASNLCAWEVDEATRLGKRIIPVLPRELGDASAPSRLKDLNYIFFYDEQRLPGSGFGSGLAQLVEALSTDLEWLREHTRYLQRATEWDTGGRTENRLLSGSDILAAKAWVQRRPKGAPAPTDLQLDFIRAGEAAQERRQNAERQQLEQMAAAQADRAKALAEREEAQKRESEQARRVVRRTLVGTCAALFLAVIAGALAWQFWRAQGNLVRTQGSLVKALAEVLADRSWNSLQTGNKDLAMRYALAGWGIAPSNVAHYRAPLAGALATAIVPQQQHLHKATVTSLAPSQNGRYVISAGRDGSMVVLDATTLQTVQTLRWSEPVTAAAIDPSGRRAFSISRDGTIRIWDISSGRYIIAIQGHTDLVSAASFSPDATRLASASFDKTARLWDLSSGGRQLATLLGHTDAVSTVVFSPDGTLLVTGSNDRTARLWNSITGKAIKTMVGHTGSVTAVAFSPDGRLVLTGSTDKTVRIWGTEGESTPIELKNHEAGIGTISVSADASRAYVIDLNGNVYIWDMRTSRIVVASIGETDNSYGLAAFAPGERYAAPGGRYAAISDVGLKEDNMSKQRKSKKGK
jgi:hypothetical protein